VDWGDGAAWVGVFVSLVASVFALRQSKRAADAVVQSASAEERQAALADAEADAGRSEPPWRIAADGNMSLVNSGSWWTTRRGWALA
jgi:hypothetical protein